MRVAFLIGEFPTLSETFILNQIVGLINQGHDVDIYASRPSKPSKVHPDVEKYGLHKRTYYYEKISKNYFLRYAKSFYLLIAWGIRYPQQVVKSLNLKKYGNHARSLRLFHEMVPFLKNRLPEYDIIHCHFGPNGVKGTHFRSLGLIKGKLSTVFHGLDVSGHLSKEGSSAYDRLFEEGNLFLPISERWKKLLIELGAPAEKTTVHHMGIDCQEFAFRPREISPGELVQITTVCRLVEKKGVEYGIRAIAELQKTWPNVHYTIVGDGPLKADLENLVVELRVANAVTMLGWRRQDEVVEVLEKTHLFLAPSVTASNGDQEGIPVALMEAMAMGIPVISTLHSGIPELIEHGVSGLLVPERDSKMLASTIENLISHPETWAEISSAAYKKVNAEFNIQTLNKKLLDIFRKATNSELAAASK